MKTRILQILIIACTLTMQLSCVSDPTKSQDQKSQKAFTAQSEIGVVVKGEMVKSFDKEREQVVFDTDKSMFMVSNMDSSIYYLIEFDGGIYLDNSINATYTSKGIDNIARGNSKLKVVKVDSANMRYWLWDNDLEIGFIIDFSI